MISLIIILLAVGAYFLLKKNLIDKFPQFGEVKIGAVIGVPLFYMAYSLSEVIRLWGAGEAIFNTTGYQHLMSGTDSRWDANILASAINNMAPETRNAWAFVSMAESCSQYLAIVVIAFCAVLIYKVFNPSVMPTLKYRIGVIISGICCVFPYLLYAIGFQNRYIWIILLIVVALFSWTYYIYNKATTIMANVSDSDVSENIQCSEGLEEESTKQCPYCGETILAIAKKCKHCGEWLTEETKESDRKYIECPVCGEEIEPDAKVCPYCNEPVPSGIEVKCLKCEITETYTNAWEQKMAQKQNSSKENNNRKYLWIVVAVVVFGLLFWYLGSNSESGSSSDTNYEDVEAPSWDNDDEFLIN